MTSGYDEQPTLERLRAALASNVTPLQPGRALPDSLLPDRPAPFPGSILQELEAYWTSLRRGRQLPARAEIDPSRIDAALPHVFVIEEVAPGVARLRVAGHRLNALMGMETRGMPLTTFFAHRARAVVANHLREVFVRPAIVEMPLLSPRSMGRPRLTGRLLILPLQREANAPARAMGAMLVDGTIGFGPRRFDVPGDGTFRTEDVPAIEAPRRGTPHLRIVVSND